MLELIILIGLIIIAVVVVNTVMKVVSIFIMIATWMLAGYLARKIIGGKGKSNPIVDAALGVAGGIIGSIILRVIGLSGVGEIWLVGGVIVGTIGAIILIYAIRVFSDNKDFVK